MPIINLADDNNLWEFTDQFITNSRNRPWLFNFVQRNAISIQSLIENDMFGNFSDFDEENPAPPPIEQIKIIRAFLAGEPLENYDVNQISEPLRNFITNIPEQARDLDNALLSAQLHREENWYAVFDSPPQYLNTLARYQMLNQMERMLDNLEAPHPDSAALQQWIEAQRPIVLNALLRAPSLSQFFRNEWNSIKYIFKIISDGAVLIARSPTPILNTSLAMVLSLYVLYKIGLIFLFPLRLIQRELDYISSFLPRRCHEVFQLVTLCAYLIMLESAIDYFSSALKMIFGLQSFSVLGAVGILLGGIYSVIYCAGLGLWALNALGVITLSVADQPAPNPVPAPAPTQTPTQQAPTTDSILLNPQQRTRLTMLLMQRRSAVSNDGGLEPEKKQNKQQKIEAELQGLRQASTPYYLSNMDRKLIRARDPIPAEFENLNLELPTP